MLVAVASHALTIIPIFRILARFKKYSEIRPFPSLVFLVSWRQDFRILLDRASSDQEPQYVLEMPFIISHSDIRSLKL